MRWGQRKRILLFVANIILCHLFSSTQILSYINIGINQINDPLKKARDYAKFSGKIVEVSIKEKSDIPYALSLIKQAYERS